MQWLVDLHSILRWVVLLAALGAVAFAVLAATGARPWDRAADVLSRIYPVSLDIQVVIGVVLWVWGRQWEQDPVLAWLHPAAMLVAVALAHVGRARADRASSSREKGKQAAIFFDASLLLVLVAIPLYSWPF